MAETHPGGVMDSVRRLSGTLLELVRARLDLLSNEVEERTLLAWQVFVLALVAMVCFGLAALVFTAVVVLLWDSHPLAALAGMGCLYLILGTLAAFAIRGKMHTRPKLFSTSLAELTKDREQLEPGHGRAQS
jgi:uncharacterized membrane protein YqjE